MILISLCGGEQGDPGGDRKIKRPFPPPVCAHPVVHAPPPAVPPARWPGSGGTRAPATPAARGGAVSTLKRGGHAKQGGQLGQSRVKTDETTLAAGYGAIGGFNLRQLIRHLLGKDITLMG